jgi:LuxR family transcriptional regulator, maltose regulon positive regulatory protein
MPTRQRSAPARVIAAGGLSVVDVRPRAQRRESVHRTPLVNRLRASGAPLVTVCAPAGYGKTTLLEQWAARDGRPFAWLTVDEGDNDPRALVASLARAFRRLPLALPRSPQTGPRQLGAALLAARRPVVVVIDDVHLLGSRASLAHVATLAANVPTGSTLALAGRSLRLGVARARAAGHLFELGSADLALSRREEDLLLGNAGVDPGSVGLSGLRERMEGWAAGTLLAALTLDRGHPEGGTGEDRFVADYFELECIAGLEAGDVRFLVRSAVLERMSGALCDHVLGANDSGGRLDALAKAQLFLVPLDREGHWYRYHAAFREYLLGELRRREPKEITALHRRAAAWCETAGDRAAAARYAHAAGDLDHVARLVTKACSSATSRSLGEAWLEWFDDVELLRRHADVAALGSWRHLLRGRPAAARRWRDALASGEHDAGRGSREPLLALLDAATCERGAEQMRADAQRAVDGVARLGPWRPAAILLRGVAELLLGDHRGAEETLFEAAEAAEAAGATETRILALAELSVLAAACGDDHASERLALEARVLIDERPEDGDSSTALALAAAARVQLRGDASRARAEVERAGALAPLLTHALPWNAVQTNLELARVHLALAERHAAHVALDRAAAILRRRPRLGRLSADAEALRTELEMLAARRDQGGSGLTTAELRLLPFLATHLSFREIAEQLFVSRNTVKTQAISVYRKLDVSTRSEAIARARGLGLVDRAPSGEFTLSG